MFLVVFPSVFAARFEMHWLISVSWITSDCFDAHDRVSSYIHQIRSLSDTDGSTPTVVSA